MKQSKKSKKKLEYKPKLLKLTCIPIDEIDELFAEQYLATGQLTYKFNSEYYSLAYFSIGGLEKADNFKKIFNTLKQGKDYKQYLSNATGNNCQTCGKPIPRGLKYCEDCVDKSSTVKRLFSFFSDVKWKMIFMICAVLVSTGISLVIPKYSTQKLYDEVLNPGNTAGYESLLGGLISIVLTMAALKITHQLFTLFYQYVVAGMLPEVIYSIKLKIFKAMQGLSVGFYTHKQTGSLMERVTRDSNNIYWFFVDGFPYLISSIITVIGIIIIMFFTSVKLTLMIIIGALLVAIIYPIMEKKFRKLHHRVWVQNAQLTSKVSDNINGHRIIKAFSKENEELQQFNKTSHKLLDAEIRWSNAEATFYPILSVVVYLLGALVLGIGGVIAITTNEISVGELLTFVVYLQMLEQPISFLSWVTNWWSRCVDSAQRVFEIMDADNEIDAPCYYAEVFGLTGWNREYAMNEYVDINGITKIGNEAFQGCTSLTIIEYLGTTEPTYDGSPFSILSALSSNNSVIVFSVSPTYLFKISLALVCLKPNPVNEATYLANSDLPVPELPLNNIQQLLTLLVSLFNCSPKLTIPSIIFSIG